MNVIKAISCLGVVGLFFCTLLAAPVLAESEAHRGLPLKPTRSIDFETDEGTWVSLDVSPDGSLIAFDLLGDIYTVPISGGKATAISTGMGYDTHPVFSPDGRKIAFVTDTSGAENIWTMAVDGSAKQQISFQETERALLSPEWSADGRYIYASLFRADLHGHALLRYRADGRGQEEEVIGIKEKDGQQSITGVSPSKDGTYLYYAHLAGEMQLGRLDKWTINRKNIATGQEERLVAAVPSRLTDPDGGSFFRPVISPDGKTLIYGARSNGKTGLRIRTLGAEDDRWLVFPIQHDQVQASHVQDILPHYSFTPDGGSLLLSKDGKITRLDIATGAETIIPFQASVSVGLGPNLRFDIKADEGPVQARLMQDPEQSPDGKKLAFSALGKLYTMPLKKNAIPKPLTAEGLPAYQPSWSPDGRFLTYITWTAATAGHVWIVPTDGSSAPRQITSEADFYTYPVFSLDGQSVIVMRSSHYARMHNYMEYGPVREGHLQRLPLSDGVAETLYSGTFGGKPHFNAAGDVLYVFTSAGLQSLKVGDTALQPVLQAEGPGWYFQEGLSPADDLKISPDGKWALVQATQQLYLVAVPEAGESQPVSLTDPQVRYRKITDVGADYFGWAEGGNMITWSIGSTYYRRPLDQVILFAPNSGNRGADSPKQGKKGVEAFPAVVEVPRDTPKGAILLRGATLITMDKAGVLENADLLIKDNKIAAVGSMGTVAVPSDTKIVDVTGRYIMPGLIDTHHHVADIRRGVLDFQSWGPAASLAYGVTTLFDPSTLSIDMMAYSDLADAGLMTGSRIFSTGMALFSFNEFQTKEEVRQVLLRYRDHYRLRNLKMYKTGNRRVRQWVAEVSYELGMMPTTEGGLAMKHGLTQVIDGFAGHEHALPVTPLHKDVVELMSKSRIGYTMTLGITTGGYEGQDFFIARDDPRTDPKINHFWPDFAVTGKFSERTWHSPDLYYFRANAASGAKILRAGGLIGIGAHGESPGIGTHWEMEAHVMGGMTPAEVLMSATIGSAEVIGREGEFGSLTVGKFADLLILTKNPLDDVRHARAIESVMKNGRLYQADTLNEVWPRNKSREKPWFSKGNYRD